jgi:hypothetical protein
MDDDVIVTPEMLTEETKNAPVVIEGLEKVAEALTTPLEDKMTPAILEKLEQNHRVAERINEDLQKEENTELKTLFDEIESYEKKEPVEKEEERKAYLKVKPKMGRPQVIDKFILKELRQAFLMGCNDTEACAYAEISPRLLYYFQNRNPNFLQYKNEWKENPILKARATVYKNLDNDETARWYLERKKRAEFATRQEVITGDISEINAVLDKLESNYDGFADRAREALSTTGAADKQVVEDKPPLQDTR